jgi:hypothetical protein
MAMTFVLILDLLLRTNPNMSWTKFIIICVATILAIVAAFVFLISRANSNFVKLWPTLAPLINGTVHKAVLTYQGNTLTGNYHGLPVRARVKGKNGGKGNPNIYHFEVLVTPGTHGRDWKLHYDQGFLGMGADGWEIKTRDEALKQRLAQSGLMTMAQNGSGETSITNDGDKGTLLYRTRIDSLYDLPTPDVFKGQLDLLTKLVNVNRQVNV